MALDGFYPDSFFVALSLQRGFERLNGLKPTIRHFYAFFFINLPNVGDITTYSRDKPNGVTISKYFILKIIDNVHLQ